MQRDVPLSNETFNKLVAEIQALRSEQAALRQELQSVSKLLHPIIASMNENAKLAENLSRMREREARERELNRLTTGTPY